MANDAIRGLDGSSTSTFHDVTVTPGLPGGKTALDVAVLASALPAGAATEATLASVLSSVDGLEGFTDGIEALLSLLATQATLASVLARLDVSLSTRASESTLSSVLSSVDGLEGFTDGIETLLTSLNALVSTASNQAAQSILIGPVTETAPATDIASSGLNGRLQRIAQRLTSLISVAATETTLASVLTSVDGLEALATTGNSTLSSILTSVDQLEGYTDGIEALIGTTNTSLSTANTTLSSILTATDQLEGYLDGVEALLTSVRDGEYSDTATLTNVTAATVTTALLAANSGRKGFAFYNDSNKDCRVAFAATASATSFTLLIPANTSHREPHTTYRGAVSGIWSAGVAGTMRVTDLT